MNAFDDKPIDQNSFSFEDLLGIPFWKGFTVSASLTVVGTPTYVGRYRVSGRLCFFQITLVSSTSIASTAGTHYVSLPIGAKGLAGVATMTNDSTNIAVGTCHIDVANSRAYLPTQGASGSTFTVAGWYEI